METFCPVVTVYSELIMIKLISLWTAQGIVSLFFSHMERCRYKQLNKQECFEKNDSAFHRIMVKIFV